MAILKVRLAHAPNPDIKGGYWGDRPFKRSEWVPVASIEQASEICRSYLNHYGLGGGNWTGGQVVQGTKKLGRIAYNGNFFQA